MSDLLAVQDFYNPADDYPYVIVELNGQRIQLTVSQARDFAAQVNDCASSAEQNAFLINFLVEKLGHPSAKVGQLLAEFADWKLKHRE